MSFFTLQQECYHTGCARALYTTSAARRVTFIMFTLWLYLYVSPWVPPKTEDMPADECYIHAGSSIAVVDRLACLALENSQTLV